MAASLATALRIPTKGAAVTPRRRRCGQLTVARASANKSASEHQEVAAAAGINGDGSAYASPGRRGAVLAVAGAVATAAVGRSAARAASNNPGGWEPIKNVRDRYIQDLGRWAVNEHGREMRFAKVVGGCQQVVAGMNYNLDIEIMDRGKKYVAALYVPPGAMENTRQLTNFVGPFDME